MLAVFEFFLKHSPEAFSKGEVILTGMLPVWVLWCTLAALALLTAVWLVWRRQVLEPRRLLLIWMLQTAMLGLLAILVWQPALRIDQLRTGDNIVALLLDVSGSMSYAEPDESRLETALALLNESDLSQALESRYTIRRYLFAGDTQAVDSFGEKPGTAGSTSLGDALLQVMGLSRSASLAAIVVASDGSDNSGRLDRTMLSQIAAFGIPVHTIGMGREEMPEDLELEEVLLPERALPGTSLSASVAVRHDVAASTRIKIYDGEKFLAARDLELPEGTAVTTAMVDFSVPDKGHHDLRFTLENLPGERDIRNNSRSRVLDVSDRTYRILYIEGEPRWEYKFLRRALEDDPSVNLVTLLRVSTNKFYRQGIENPDELEDGFPTEKTALFKFDALIIGSIEAPYFSREQQDLIRDFVSIRGGSLMMLAGPNGLGDGGWGNSGLSEVLPARLDTAVPSFRRERARVAPTAIGRTAPMLRFSDDPDENLTEWNELPEIADYQILGALRPAAVSLLNIRGQQGEQPLLIMQPYGRGHSYILATGGIWRWQMGLPVEDMHHETFWRQLSRGLVTNVPDRFELSTRIADDRISIQARLLDESYEPVRDLSVTAVVSPEEGEPVTLELQPAPEQPGLLQAEFTPESPGLYQIDAISRRGDLPMESSALALRYDRGDAEHFGLRQDRTTLETIADLTGGSYWQPDNLDQLPDVIRHSGAGITEQLLLPLWNAPVFFILLLLLKGAEWLLRRSWRTI
ncbi:MAG: hypothetical protein A3I78_11295 [Gammaproteobacteria bacterium RIFCSPLOWO2_02_FULL_56_15]|nr:MAG: hypothetical protein A3I78_11295 [Gammaproteobacteria bacterium RIFCSPLOWO2_02_FULL_56_15]